MTATWSKQMVHDYDAKIDRIRVKITANPNFGRVREGTVSYLAAKKKKKKKKKIIIIIIIIIIKTT